MPDTESPSVAMLETQITELLGRRVYYPATEVAGLIIGTSNE